MKTIAHIPLAIYVTLTPGDGAVDDDRLKTLAGLRELIPHLKTTSDPPIGGRELFFVCPTKLSLFVRFVPL